MIDERACDACREKSLEAVSMCVNGPPSVVNRQTKKRERTNFSVSAPQKSVNGRGLFCD